MPSVEVSPWLIIILTSLVGAFFFFVFRTALVLRRRPAVTGAGALIGNVGNALTDLKPEGRVKVNSEEWSARADKNTKQYLPIKAGEEVEIIDIEGVTLIVKRKSQVQT